MKNFSAKNKIIFLALGWLILSFAMFIFFFKIMDHRNQQTLDSMAEERKALVVLQAESDSYKKAQADLDQLSGMAIQPDNFFSSDINLVNEIKTLEALSQKYNVQMQLSGVSGTINSAPKANTVTPIVVVPYSISLNGDLSSAVNFIENLENLSFITNVSSLAINAADKGLVHVSLAANFYLKK
jgi:hypothetical protein